jgi:hypothetical protein
MIQVLQTISYVTLIFPSPFANNIAQAQHLNLKKVIDSTPDCVHIVHHTSPLSLQAIPNAYTR